MKIYVKPMTIIEPLAINPHPVEYSWGTDWAIDHQIDGVGDVELQAKQQKWGDLW